MPPPRVLLLEDDPAVRRFVQLALDSLSVDLVPCATLAEARQALADSAVRLVLTDLTLPDGSGLDLLQWLQGRAQPSDGGCRTVVFSGGIDPAVERRLKALQVWRVLRKPVSVGVLMACVSEALAGLAPQVPPAPPAAAMPRPDPVAEFFGGNRPLYDAYRTACLAQFTQDLDDGDLAARAGDAQALRRVAHNLKSVLTMLGEAQAAQTARDTEEAAVQGATAAVQECWRLLRGRVQALLVVARGRC